MNSEFCKDWRTEILELSESSRVVYVNQVLMLEYIDYFESLRNCESIRTEIPKAVFPEGRFQYVSQLLLQRIEGTEEPAIPADLDALKKFIPYFAWTLFAGCKIGDQIFGTLWRLIFCDPSTVTLIHPDEKGIRFQDIVRV